MKRFPAGRIGEAPSVGLSASLNSAGFKLGRLQTGTPARLDGKTIDFSNMLRQDGDSVPSPFSFLHIKWSRRVYISVAIYKKHEKASSPQNTLVLPLKLILAKGPRYCPSIEAKVLRFGHKDHHTIWLEPEGYDSGELTSFLSILANM